jgi:acetylornithine deacetylase/succinyl-diaminopimelate desuccinylase-like protein
MQSRGETETGMSRLSLSDADKQARDWFVDTTKSLGCTVKVDAMGNIFAVRPGKRIGPPTCAGSHLDTQPSGGRYVCKCKARAPGGTELTGLRMEFSGYVLE